MNWLTTRVVGSNNNSSNNMAVLSGTIPANAALGTYKYLVTIAYDYMGKNHSFTFEVDVKVVPATFSDQFKTITLDTKVGQPIKSGSVNYDVPSGHTSTGIVSNDSNYPDTVKEYGLSGSFMPDSISFSGTPIKAGVATITVVLEYPTYDYYVTFEINITEASALLVITMQPLSVNIISGGSATFTVVASGEGLHYKWWYVDAGAPFSFDIDSPTLTMINVQSGWGGMNFWCVVSNAAGEVESEKAKLTVSDSSYVFPFTDIKPANWFYNDVKNANQMGLIDGKTATLYMPNDNITYAEAIKLAACMHQLAHGSMVTLTNASPIWYSTYIDYAKENGIPCEYPNYNAKITRAEYVHIFYYALPASRYTKINDIAALPDVSNSTAIGKEIYALYEASILTGNDTKGTFAPNTNIKRSEVAAVLSRMMDESTRKTFTLK